MYIMYIRLIIRAKILITSTFDSHQNWEYIRPAWKAVVMGPYTNILNHSTKQKILKSKNFKKLGQTLTLTWSKCVMLYTYDLFKKKKNSSLIEVWYAAVSQYHDDTKLCHYSTTFLEPSHLTTLHWIIIAYYQFCVTQSNAKITSDKLSLNMLQYLVKCLKWNYFSEISKVW